jgi:hypothetical protein
LAYAELPRQFYNRARINIHSLEPLIADREDTVHLGGARVRLLEAADVLLAGSTTPHERVAYGLTRDSGRQALRELNRDLEKEISAQIMQASEKALETVKDVIANVVYRGGH